MTPNQTIIPLEKPKLKTTNDFKIDFDLNKSDSQHSSQEEPDTTKETIEPKLNLNKKRLPSEMSGEITP